MDRTTLATGGLLLAWLANDLEELLTYTDSVRRMRSRLPGWVPTPPPPDQTHVTVAIAAVGVTVAAAAVAGVRSGGRSQFFQDSLWAFGMHGFGHLGQAGLTRGYTTGVVTAPTVVIPFWWWATRTLERAGVPQRPRRGRAVAQTLGVLVGAHTLGHLASRARRCRRERLRGLRR
ncbi:HXXEE domain-containing protein [Naumannella sp. ID2617S]|uniref:HXXEE domain-containing protein n=1 Tax=Enemella dayhoffiae TaxID=2016507 RepID=A0A255H9M2_9ACTN|nr:HXXEE domain-containing protein [Enemella dayhoffiae]NNG18192.1 HXXEE domain-containing protein [Naumannella sp. ID2617S]OYO23966.1 HXXEE domain-containing protein [Enemella dayhoffiae]